MAPSTPTKIRENKIKDPSSIATSADDVMVSSRRSTSPMGTVTKQYPSQKSPSSSNIGSSYFSGRHPQKENTNDSSKGWDSSKRVPQSSEGERDQFPGNELAISPHTVASRVEEGPVDTTVSPMESPCRVSNGKRPPDLPMGKGVDVERNNSKTSKSNSRDVGVGAVEAEAGITYSGSNVSTERLRP